MKALIRWLDMDSSQWGLYLIGVLHGVGFTALVMVFVHG